MKQYGLKTGKAVAALVTRKPEWVEPACALLLEGEEAAFDGTWEMVLSSPELRQALKPQLLAKAKEMDDVWSDGGDPEWEAFGEEVVALMVEAGVMAAPTEEEIAARAEAKKKAEEEARVAKEQRAKELAEAKVAAAKARAEAEAEKAARSDEDVFWDAVNDCTFEVVLNDAERFKALILENVSDIADNFTEDNAYVVTGDEPNWLLDLFRDNGVFTEPSLYSYYRIQADDRDFICKTVDEFFNATGAESYDTIEGVTVDPNNCVVGNFYWNDSGFEPELVSLANGDDFDAFITSEDGGTGHFVYEYFEVIVNGKVVKRVEGTDPENPYPPNVQKFADAVGGSDQTAN